MTKTDCFIRAFHAKFATLVLSTAKRVPCPLLRQQSIKTSALASDMLNLLNFLVKPTNPKQRTRRSTHIAIMSASLLTVLSILSTMNSPVMSHPITPGHQTRSGADNPPLDPPSNNNNSWIVAVSMLAVAGALAIVGLVGWLVVKRRERAQRTLLAQETEAQRRMQPIELVDRADWVKIFRRSPPPEFFESAANPHQMHASSSSAAATSAQGSTRAPRQQNPNPTFPSPAAMRS